MDGVRRGTLGLALSLTAVLSGCGPGEPAAPPPEPPPSPGEEAQVTLVAPEGAETTGFDRDRIGLPAGQPVTIRFENRDPGILHNVSIYQDETAEVAIFQGEIITGVADADYSLTAPEPGLYFFRCDVHPETMTGTVEVA